MVIEYTHHTPVPFDVGKDKPGDIKAKFTFTKLRNTILFKERDTSFKCSEMTVMVLYEIFCP